MNDTHKVSATPRYPDFAAYLLNSRRAENIGQHSDLAKLLGVSQQTISRWEAGLSRPRTGQIEALAEAVKRPANEVLVAAGYTVERLENPLDLPLTLDGLLPESFERFAGDFLTLLFPGARVYREGGPGHTQAGIDLTVKNTDGKTTTIQCKQVREFGPKEVLRAIEKDTTVSDRKVLLLSRTASPQARAAINGHPEWEIWDRDDVSRKFRQLSLDDKKRLVRTYFRGQELELLGSAASGVWETPYEFFAPFDREIEGVARRLFTHTWSLVGRSEVVDEIVSGLEPGRMVLLTGAAGAGKSRVLKEVLSRYDDVYPGAAIRFASATADITNASLEELPTTRLLLVVDDAHDRGDLQGLYAYAAVNRTRVVLLISARSYGAPRIRSQASGYSFSDDLFTHIALPALPLIQVEELARQVLKDQGGPDSLAKDIARQTQECALDTVLAAQIVAKKNVALAFLTQDVAFKTTVIGRFEEVINGKLSETEDPKHVQLVMGFLALVQPFRIDDPELLGALQEVDGTPLQEVRRIIRLLIEAGVLFKRGGRHRLAPDVLGDYLLETRFQQDDGQSNGHVERYFDALPKSYLENLLVNLGRVDWRKSGGKTDQSQLLDGVWAKIEPRSEYSDPHIAAVKAVAYYQPKRALEFLERQIRAGQFLEQLPEIAKFAAYTTEYQTKAMRCLWALGRLETRETNPHPSHAIRILQEMAKPEPGKPLEVLSTALNFVRAIIPQATSWGGKFTPLDIADSLLATEGHTSTYDHYSISMNYFSVPYAQIKPIREELVDLLCSMLTDPDLRKSVRAGQSLATALRGPIGGMNAAPTDEDRLAWDRDFARTLTKVQDVLVASNLDPLVQTEVQNAVQWLAGHGTSKIAVLARGVIEGLSSTLDARLDRVLLDGYGHSDRLGNLKDHTERWAKFVDNLVAEFIETYATGEAMVAELERRIRRIEESGSSQRMTSEVLGGRLIERSPEFADAIIDQAWTTPHAKLTRFAGYALGRLFRADRSKGRQIIARWMDSGRADLMGLVGHTYEGQRYEEGWFEQSDEDNLTALLRSNDANVVHSALRALRYIAEWNLEVGLRLFRQVHIADARVADELSALFEFGEGLQPKYLTREDVTSLLAKLFDLPELDGFWLDKLLASISELYPHECAYFLMRRVDVASSDDEDGKMRPINYGPWAHERLRFRRVAAGPAIMREVIQWMLERSESRGLFSYYARSLFEAMFAPFDAEMVSFFSVWLNSATAEDIKMMGIILRETDRDFIFDQVAFIVALLDRAQQFDPELRKMVASELYCATFSGIKHGSPGQPFPEDVGTRDRAAVVLATLDPFSPAYELYDHVRLGSEQAIAHSLREAEDFE